MKLTDMLNAMTTYSKQFEGKAAEWQAHAEKWTADAQAQAAAWYKDAESRMTEANAQFAKYAQDASENARAEWTKAEGVWEQQFAEVQAKSEELRQSVASYEANARAEASEAYAAAMSKFAMAVQSEAEKAVAFAAETKGSTKG